MKRGKKTLLFFCSPENGRRRRGLQQPLDRSQTPAEDAPGRGRRGGRGGGGRRGRARVVVAAVPLLLLLLLLLLPLVSASLRRGREAACRCRRFSPRRPSLEADLKGEGDDARREHGGDVARPGCRARGDREQQGAQPLGAPEKKRRRESLSSLLLLFPLLLLLLLLFSFSF